VDRVGQPVRYAGRYGSGVMKRDTRLIHGSRHKASTKLAETVGPPIQRGSTVLLPNAAAIHDYSQISYGRQGLASHQALVAALAEMEGASDVSLFPSGLAAITGTLLAVVKAGDEILAADSVYRPTRRFCDTALARLGVSTRYFEPALSAEGVLALATPATRLIMLETPGSLTMDMQDMPGIARAARARGILTAVDNTWAAGLLFKPIAHEIDISIQSLTKYVGGHSDVFMGSAATANPAVAKLLDAAQLEMGWAVAPDDAYFMLRGLRTLGTRLERHEANAMIVARWLESHGNVLQVLSFIARPGSSAAVDTFLDALTLFGLGYSWGGFESLAIPGDPQFACRVFQPRLGGPVIRLQIGLEDPDDLISDLDQALAAYATA
jgi:cysteine-S-conjugate beta-lyase